MASQFWQLIRARPPRQWDSNSGRHPVKATSGHPRAAAQSRPFQTDSERRGARWDSAPADAKLSDQRARTQARHSGSHLDAPADRNGSYNALRFPPAAVLMRHYPDFESFCKLAQSARWVPVYRRLLGDSLTPVSAFHKIDTGSSACLFESVIGGEKVGRYSFLAADPFLELEASGQTVSRHRRPDGRQEFDSADPLEELRQRVEAIRPAVLPELPPFTSGAVGYAGYDVVRYSERLPHPPAERSQSARSGVCLLRPHGRLRPREQDQRRGGDGPARRIGRDAAGRLRRRPAPHRRPGGPARSARPRAGAGRHRRRRRARRWPIARISPRPNSSRRSRSASSTSAPATSFRS